MTETLIKLNNKTLYKELYMLMLCLNITKCKPAMPFLYYVWALKECASQIYK